ncbi:Intracellular ribonuclease LX [Linum perenne]
MMKMKFVMLLVLICMLTKPAAAAVPFCCQNFDFYALAMEWGPGYCSLFKEYCNEPHLEDFTLHDLRRSSQYDDRGCPSDRSWGTEDLKANLTNSGVPDLISNLERNWPGGWTMPGGWYTWTQAWNQYGVCTGLTPIVYFNSTLNIRGHGDNLRWLSFDGIVPTNNNTYKARDIYGSLGHSAILRGGSRGGVP